jgi:putative intracellular protease/amidase
MRRLTTIFALLLLAGGLGAALLLLYANTPSRQAQAQGGGQQAPSRSGRRNVAILIFEGVQIIDYTGPFEVFGQAGFNVYTVAEKAGPLTTSMGMIVTPNYTLENGPRPDVIVLPGGDVERTVESPAVMKWIRDGEKDAQHLLSVCNGAFILARTGLIDGLSATTFYDLIDDLKRFAPKTKVLSDRRYVDNGKYISTAGISSGIDGSLHVVSKLLGRGRAQMAALNMEYDWDPDSKYARAALADRHVRKIFGRMLRIESPAVTNSTVLSTQGGTDGWEVVWEVESASPASELLKDFDRRLAGSAGWRARVGGAAAGTNASTWDFSGEDNSAWSGRASVNPLLGASGKFTVTLRIERGSRA